MEEIHQDSSLSYGDQRPRWTDLVSQLQSLPPLASSSLIFHCFQIISLASFSKNIVCPFSQNELFMFSELVQLSLLVLVFITQPPREGIVRCSTLISVKSPVVQKIVPFNQEAQPL